MRRSLTITCSFTLIAAVASCSRVPSSRRNPIEDPRGEAENGDAGAQYELGVRIADAPGGSPDYGQAAGWFRRAAEQGHPGAQAALGYMCHRGQGVPRSDIEALKWLNLATWQDSAEHDAYTLWREYVVRDMTNADVAEGERLARAWTTSPPTPP